MPIYEYRCEECGKVTEQLHSISKIPKRIRCDCGMSAVKIISSKGAVFSDGDVKWLGSAIKVLQPDYERPIQTRGEYKNYLKSRNLACIG